MPKYRHRVIGELLYAPVRLCEAVPNFFKGLRNRSQARVEIAAKLLPECTIYNFSPTRDSIRIGNNSLVRAELCVFAHGGCIEVGEWCYIGAGTRIWSAAEIKIGNRTLIAHEVEIHDTNAHAISAQDRHNQFREMLEYGHQTDLPDVGRSSIVIGDDVWIGFRSAILKGVNIGNGAIVSAYSLVTDDVAPWTVVGGNPARVIRELKPEY